MTQVTDIHSLPDIAYHQGYAPVVVARVARVSPAWRGAASIAPPAPSRTRTRAPSIRAAGAPPRRWRSPAPSAAATTPPSWRRAPHFQRVTLLFFKFLRETSLPAETKLKRLPDEFQGLLDTCQHASHRCCLRRRCLRRGLRGPRGAPHPHPGTCGHAMPFLVRVCSCHHFPVDPASLRGLQELEP